MINIQLAIGIALGVLVAGSLQQLRVLSAERELARNTAAYSERIIAATENEKLLSISASRLNVAINRLKADLNEEQAKNAKLTTEKLRATGNADTELRRLREANATLNAKFNIASARTTDTATLARNLKAATTTIGVLTRLRDESAERAGERAVFAQQAYERGLSCQRDYESAREAIKKAQSLGDQAKTSN